MLIGQALLVENVHELGPYLGDILKAKLGNHPNVGDIRGKGFFWGIEFVKDKLTKEPFDPQLDISKKIVDLALSEKYNLALFPGKGTVDGVKGDHIIISPPFTTTKEDIDHIAEVLSKVVIEILGKENNK